MKKYYMIMRVIYNGTCERFDELICIVEDEDIARDFCEKHKGYRYIAEEVTK